MQLTSQLILYIFPKKLAKYISVDNSQIRLLTIITLFDKDIFLKAYFVGCKPLADYCIKWVKIQAHKSKKWKVESL
jgi:hypothetical protein